MPPKTPSKPLPKGQASLSTFFGGKGTGSSPASSQEARSTTRSTAATASAAASPSANNKSASSTSSKYFASKADASSTRPSATATKADPMVIDDSDDDNNKPAPRSKPKSSHSTPAKSSPTKSAAKRKANDDSSDDEFVVGKGNKHHHHHDDDDDEFEPAPKRPATTASRAKAGATAQPPRRAAANAKPIKIDDSDDDDDDDFEDAPPPKASANGSKRAPPAKAPPAAKKEVSEPQPPASAPAADKKPSWREMAARRAAGPAAPGSKEIPQGQPNCLAGLTLVFTGELSSISRDEATDLAKRYGARITGAPSSKTSFVVLGEGAGPKKLDSIKKNKIATLDEDGFLDMIRTRGAGQLDEKAKQKIKAEEEKIKEVARSMGPPKDANINPTDFANQLWTTKYAPTQMKDLVGNKAAVEKLAGWLKAWPSSYRSNFKKPGPTGMNVYRAVLISGPPGIGKTTSAHLVAKMEGYQPIEFNASDTRGKKIVESMLQDTINNKSLDSWYSNITKASSSNDAPRIHDRTVLIMDEVDGMSGGDRGGIGAINALIKKTKVPIICICNDRRNQKMRPFEHTTYNLSFRKPDANQVKSRMLSIAFKEKLKIPGEVMAQLIEAAQSDIRSVINMLSTWKLSKDTMNFDESKSLGAENTKPGLHTPFSLYSELTAPGMFNATSKKTLNDKADLYFQDHSFVPLMVAENYVKARPVLVSRETPGPSQQIKQLELLRRASESISDGDLVDRMIHGGEQHWSLMPLHAIASTVRPCSYIYGGTEGGFPSFPAWLGQNSKQQRLTRAVVDLQAKMRLICSGSRHDLRQHYLPSMWSMLLQPMVENGTEGVEQVISLMDEYYLGIEDREAILELGLEPNNAEVMLKKIPSAVKAGFTRKYNATNHPIAFHKATDLAGMAGTAKMKIGKSEVPDLEDVVEEEEIKEEDNEDEDGKRDDDADDLSKDKLVKKPKTTVSKGKGKAKSSGKK
ncbi:related to replication factor C protein [Ustilago trichophora]|uniref:Replication factor C subunit 1 n=1 Tax=Ustilago trichophora TaxID=86804 RepID=A0A5C3ERP6_9BASI|nr:related to replication factor C protein [Ustilago trichophora]